MTTRSVLVLAAISVSLLRAQTATAITGTVSSGDEAVMEGVLVSATQMGSPITITVVSDRAGRYRFPASRLDPGQYTLHIRAAGYELDNIPPIDVPAGKAATVDLKLRKAKDLSVQLTNAEWIASMPGTDAQKTF